MFHILSRYGLIAAGLLVFISSDRVCAQASKPKAHHHSRSTKKHITLGTQAKAEQLIASTFGRHAIRSLVLTSGANAARPVSGSVALLDMYGDSNDANLKAAGSLNELLGSGLNINRVLVTIYERGSDRSIYAMEGDQGASPAVLQNRTGS